MAIKEQDKVFYEELANGDKVINLPVTRANNVEGLGRSANTAYSVGDVVYVDNNKKVALKCITTGTTSNTELNISTNNIGDTVTDGSVVWQVCNRTSDVTSVNGKTGDIVVDLPVGHMYWSVEPNVPAGRLPASGALYNRPLYQGLYNWANERGLVISESEWQAIASANDGNCAYYSSGDGSTTFRVPKLPTTIASDVPSEVPVVGNGMAIGITDGSSNFGLYESENYQFPFVGVVTSAYGANVGTIRSGGTHPGVNTVVGLTTEPTKSGIVAQTSATKITGQWLIVAFGVAHNIGEADVADVMSAVEQVQTGLGALEQGVGTAIDYIVESYRNGTEWYEVYKSGKVRQGGTLTIANNVAHRITFLKPFANTNYQKNVTHSDSSGNAVTYARFGYDKTSTSMIIYGAGTIVDWVAEGQGA